MNNLSGNKGEWSEIYTFLKLLSEGKLYGADGNLNKKEDVFYDIIKIIRNEQIGTLHFLFDKENKNIEIKDDNGETQITISIQAFQNEADYLYNEIVNTKGKSAFKILQTSEFLNDIMCHKLKAPSIDKSDITIKVHDFNTGLNPTLGFSIKSRLGKPATLFNAGANTNFIFELIGNITDEDMNTINNLLISKEKSGVIKHEISIASRMNYILDHGFKLKFSDMTGTTFKNNLILIDSDLPAITGYMMLEYYLNGRNNICEALKKVNEQNPLEYDLTQGHEFYKYKFKKLLTESALGMLPGKVWSGKTDASGGYIIVREDGEVLCYHLYNRNDFEDYLLKNTKFDRGSASRHGYATVEKNDGRYFIKLNLQIRFIR